MERIQRHYIVDLYVLSAGCGEKEPYFVTVQGLVAIEANKEMVKEFEKLHKSLGAISVSKSDSYSRAVVSRRPDIHGYQPAKLTLSLASLIPVPLIWEWTREKNRLILYYEGN